MEEKHSKIICGTLMGSTLKAISWVTILPSPLLATKCLVRGRTRHRQKPRRIAGKRPGRCCEWAPRILIRLLILTVSEASVEEPYGLINATACHKQRLQTSI